MALEHSGFVKSVQKLRNRNCDGRHPGLSVNGTSVGRAGAARTQRLLPKERLADPGTREPSTCQTL